MRQLAWPLVFSLAVGLGCERPVDEPEPRASVRRDAATSSAPDIAVAPAGPPGVVRCVHPTPSEPSRPPPPPGPDESCPEDPGRPKLAWGKVVFPEVGTEVDVELAKNDLHRQRGLMFRRELPASQGMLFVFERPRVQTFWMKNTCLPLDMLFIDPEGLIVGIEENVPTMNTRTYSVPCPSLYVLEVNAGWARRHGVVAGQRVRFEGIEG